MNKSIICVHKSNHFSLYNRRNYIFRMFFSFFSSVCLVMFLKGHFFSSCHLSVCTDVYPCRLSRPSCWRHRVTFPHHMITVPAYQCCTSCLYSHTSHSTKLLQMCAVPSLHLPAFTRLVQLWLRNPDWRPRNHAQRVLISLCLSVVHVQLDTGWSECTYVYEPKVLVFSHESERQEILTGQLCVSTNINTLIKTEWKKPWK